MGTHTDSRNLCGFFFSRSLTAFVELRNNSVITQQQLSNTSLRGSVRDQSVVNKLISRIILRIQKRIQFIDRSCEPGPRRGNTPIVGSPTTLIFLKELIERKKSRNSPGAQKRVELPTENIILFAEKTDKERFRKKDSHERAQTQKKLNAQQ